MQKITTCLWFDSQAEEAANFYVSVFKAGGRKAKILRTAYYPKSAEAVSGKPEGSVMTVEYELDGMKFVGLNGGPIFKFTPAVSFMISCKDQKEVDYFWEKMSAVKEAEQCGWIRDKYGLSWQIVPEILDKLLQDKNKVKSEKVMTAMLQMKKLDIEDLERAHKSY